MKEKNWRKKNMKRKIVGICICTLLIATTFPVVGMEINNEFITNDFEDSSKKIYSELNPPQVSPIFWHIDQKQDKNCGWGAIIVPPWWWAQEFKPSKEKLIGVELWMFKHENPPAGLQITVSIRDALNGSDLTVTTVSADQITKKPIWVLFDFDDITVTPENTYYILCRGGGGENPNLYCWLYNSNNSYNRGIAWSSMDEGSTWNNLENNPDFLPQVDFCFKTYNSKPKTKPIIFNSNLLGCLFDRFPNIFRIIQQLLGFQ
jgi:hypothetical protein